MSWKLFTQIMVPILMLACCVQGIVISDMRRELEELRHLVHVYGDIQERNVNEIYQRINRGN